MVGNWKPGQAGFLTLGQTYVDPIFGVTIKRMTVQDPTVPGVSNDIYERTEFWSANSTYFINSFADGTVKAVRASDAATFPLVNKGFISRVDASCHPVNDDEYWYSDNTKVYKQSISTGVSTLVYDFLVPIGSLGGSLNRFDDTGQYYLVNLPTTTGTIHPVFTVYDTVNNILFSGGATFDPQTGYATITPDGNFVVVNGGAGSGQSKFKYPIDKVNHTVGSTDVSYTATLSGDHAYVCKLSDGNTYLINVNNDLNPAKLQRLNIADGSTTPFLTLPNGGTPDAYWSSQPGHFSVPRKGAYKDWVFISTESSLLDSNYASYDFFNSTDTVTYWSVMQSEIYMVNCLDGRLRRLCHTRARQEVYRPYDYNTESRICVSPDGSKFAYVSNYGAHSSPIGYGDLYIGTMPT